MTITKEELERLAKGLTEAQRETILSAEVLADGRILVPAYSVPDLMTSRHSVHRSALNRLCLALRAHLEQETGQ